jgi:hypothetical protein
MFKNKRNSVDLTPVSVKNVASSKGVRASRYDELIKYFNKPGDTIEYPPDLVSSQMGSNIAKRLALISGKRFHSYKDGISKMICIRLRPDGENEQDEEEQEEQEE